MLIVRGSVVRAVAGRDKSKFFVVTNIDDKCADICDGKRRPLCRTKRKNFRHLSLTKVVLGETSLKTDKAIRIALREFL
ncbi:MAG: KOW domain-containing RNA-binding protein [Oscillospiraceae bacterium]|jgi:ribosomal protein L14E/L6E/L27E|nr:KOW domain-containing RNA-binding protein [Oscillospiraceae bacterium]